MPQSEDRQKALQEALAIRHKQETAAVRKAVRSQEKRRKRSAGDMLDALLQTTEHPLVRFESLHERVNPHWGDHRHPWPLREDFAAYLDERRARAGGPPSRLRAAQGPVTLLDARRHLARHYDPRLSLVVELCGFAGQPERAAAAVIVERGLMARCSQQSVSKLLHRALNLLEHFVTEGFPPIPEPVGEPEEEAR